MPGGQPPETATLLTDSQIPPRMTHAQPGIVLKKFIASNLAATSLLSL